MGKTKINKARDELIQDMDKNLNIIKQVNKLPSPLTIDIVHSIYELVFLKIYLSWESFISRIFILFMIGEKTDSGYTPICYVTPKDETHAYDIIKSGRPFPDWLNLEFIREKSELFFKNGEPFKTAFYSKSNVLEALKNMKILRNAIVHASKEAREKFESMLRNEFGSAKNILPGEFLATIRHKTPKISYIEYYKKILEAVSNAIVR